MKLRTIILISTLVSLLGVRAQELSVKEMKAAPMDLSASQYERKDLMGKPCGLVKVQLAAKGAQFEGNIVEPVEHKTGEYWVYLTEGSHELRVKHPRFAPLSVDFRDHDITGIAGKATYKLTLLMPATTEKLTINYTPADAIVLIDSRPYQGDGHLELELPVGFSYDYQIVALGYETAEGTVKLNVNSPSTITKNLTAINTTSVTDSTLSTENVESFTVKGVSFNMVHVEGGPFWMGASEAQRKPESDEKPLHIVVLSSYCLGETEVTQDLWEAVMGGNPSRFKGADRPVEQVSWIDCQEFIARLNSLTGRLFRLPTEAEWEYAAYGGNQACNYQYSGSNRIDHVAVYEKNSNGSASRGTQAVKSKQPNELGLYDMSGNVREWCQDWYGAYSIISPPPTDPPGPSSGSKRVIRGGAWNSSARGCRITYRNYDKPGYLNEALGMRLALSTADSIQQEDVQPDKLQ